MARSTRVSRMPRRLSCMIRPIWSGSLAMASDPLEATIHSSIRR
jgi:hypothetical protein